MVTGHMQMQLLWDRITDQKSRREAFSDDHPGAEFPAIRVGGLLLAWVPFESGGVQFSGRTEGELLDDAEEFFREAEEDPG